MRTPISPRVAYKITQKMTLSAQGTNLTNKFSITEGNPRGNSVIAGTNAYGLLERTCREPGKSCST